MTNPGIYIHIPFCLSKCPYCDFYSSVPGPGDADEYTAALLAAIDILSAEYTLSADTLFFGGGTPTLLGARNLSKVIDAVVRKFNLPPGAEITVEANPDTVNGGLLAELRQAGANRLSVGAQSFNDNELAALGRRHDAQSAADAVLAAYDAGFDNISIDLMLATPHQTADSLARTLERVVSLPVTHISAYLLKVEKGTPFYGMDIVGLAPDEDETADMYLTAADFLEAHGFPQYEISNFAKAGFECRHNLKYWDSVDVLGIGPAAHSLIGGNRLYFGRDTAGFIKQALSGKLAFLSDGDTLTLNDYVMLRLRLTEGLVFADAKRRFPAFDKAKLLASAVKFKPYGLVNMDNGHLSLTKKGFLLSNTVIGEMLVFEDVRLR